MTPRKPATANLGLATTDQLLEEVECRLRFGALSGSVEAGVVLDGYTELVRLRASLPVMTLEYRTVDES